MFFRAGAIVDLHTQSPRNPLTSLITGLIESRSHRVMLNRMMR